ncbi:MAG: PSD1 and planctomycete cytochrome C domain-containing protein [Chthoniobacteraceae bacterium]
MTSARAFIPTFAAMMAGVALGAGDPIEQFEREVRPILETHCFDCHGPDRQKGGLRLDDKPAMLGGGDSGEAAVVPGNSAESALIGRILTLDPDEKMPPKGDRLKPEEIVTLRRWIDNGAHLPASRKTEHPIEVVEEGMTITDKDREFWAFRVPRRSEPPAVDFEGWPRQPIDRFIAASLREHGLRPSPEAPRRVLIRRLTLDLTGLPPTPEEVDAFLADTAPDVVERAVDRLLASPRFGERMASLWLPLARYAEDQAHQVGADTKYFYPNAYRYRAWVIDAFNRDVRYDEFLKLQLAADHLPSTAPEDLAALGFLGLGPKYYNRDRMEVMADEWEDRVDTVTRTMLGLTVACARCHDHKFDPITTRDYYALAGVFSSTRMVNKSPDGQVDKEGTKGEKMRPAVLHIVEDGKVADLNVFVRGNVERKGPVVERRFIEVIARKDASAFSDGSGRRELAEAIASRDNPLTARVLVNRVWALFFGQGLVPTPSNFGHSGSQPSHPRLLDDLAVRFMEQGWSIKSLVREIVLSAAYRQESALDAAKAASDPENEQLWRMNRRRLSIEQWRDSVLAVSGELAEAPGAKSQEIDDPKNVLRTVYARVSRLKLADLLMQFDYPDANVHAEKRSVTTTPPQKLFMLNSTFMQRAAAALAARLRGAAEDDDARVALAYRLLFGREADASERRLALDFLHKPDSADVSRWEQYAQVLLASNEMLYVD